MLVRDLASMVPVEKTQTVRGKLSQWESHLAPLTEGQMSSYLQLSAEATAKPFPTQVILCYVCKQNHYDTCNMTTFLPCQCRMHMLSFVLPHHA